MSLPVDHATATQGVLDVIAAVATHSELSEAALSELLQHKGYSEIHAEKLTAFVPSAFACALLHRMGVSLASHYIAKSGDAIDTSLPIADEHYFTAALVVAQHTLENGWSHALPRQVFEAVVARSAEMAAVNNAMASGASIAGGSLQPLRVFRFSAEAAREG